MFETMSSLALILVLALVAPIAASAIPRKPIPEVVFLLFLGAIFGPNGFGLIQVDEGISLVGEIGLAFLFLLAGYDIEPRELAGKLGRTAAVTWVACAAIAFVLVGIECDETPTSLHDIALAIALTTTAFGTLSPILKDRGLTKTPVGAAVTAHGVVGELFPIVAISVLLSSTSSIMSLLILILFIALAVVMAVIPARARERETRIFRAVVEQRDTSSYTLVRFAIGLMLCLVSLCAFLDLDVVLGGFAAGFALRYIMPASDHSLEKKVEIVGNSFFVPAFFVISGAGIDLLSVLNAPGLLFAFMGMLLAARTVPVFVSTFFCAETRRFSPLQRLDVALYSTMALPLIVAVCNIATAGGFMTERAAGTLVTAGALTILVMPVVTSLTRLVEDAHPVAAISEIASHPSERHDILKRRAELFHDAREQYKRLRQDPHFDPAHDAGVVLADFNAARLELLAEMRATELQRLADAKGQSASDWQHVVDDRRHRWEEIKRNGDEAWERVKELGDIELEQMGEEGARFVQERLSSLEHAREILLSISSDGKNAEGKDAAVGEKPVEAEGAAAAEKACGESGETVEKDGKR